MMRRRRVWDPDADARNQNGENNALQRKYRQDTQDISDQCATYTFASKTSNLIPKSVQRARACARPAEKRRMRMRMLRSELNISSTDETDRVDPLQWCESEQRNLDLLTVTYTIGLTYTIAMLLKMNRDYIYLFV